MQRARITPLSWHHKRVEGPSRLSGMADLVAALFANPAMNKPPSCAITPCLPPSASVCAYVTSLALRDLFML